MFGAPIDAIAWMMKLCRNCSAILKVRIIKRLTSHSCDVKQGYILMVIQLAAQDLESELKNNNITILKALVSSKAENVIRKHKNNNTKKHVTNYDTNSTMHRRRCYPI